MRVNLNDNVKVKLTDEGIRELARQHAELRKHLIESGSNDIGEFVLKLSDDGFYTTQLWQLIKDFQDYFGLGQKTVIENADIHLIFPRSERGVFNG